MPLVSIILTSYNHAPFLRMSIDSILSQSFKDFILYIIDDCSTDTSWNIIQSYTDPRIHAKQTPYNLGGGATKALLKEKKITTKYTAIAHSDDAWKPDKLEKQIQYLESHPEISACFTNVILLDEENNIFQDATHPYMSIFNQPNRSRFDWLNYFFYHGNCLCHPSLLIKTAAYSSFDLFSYGLSSLPDFRQWIRLCINTDIWILDEPLTFFRVHKNAKNTSGNSPAQQNRLYTEDYLVLEEYLNIKTSADFIKVFPQAKNFVVDGKINIPFAFSQILLSSKATPQQRLFGIEILYKLFNNEKERNEILSLYGYDNRQFNNEKQKYDIFSLSEKPQYQCTSLYIDLGNGFSKENQIKKNTLVSPLGRFEVSFNLNTYSNIKNLLFVPDEGCFRKYKIEHLEILDADIFKISNNASYLNNDWEYFFNTAPQYNIEINETEEIKVLSVAGYSLQINPYEIESFIQDLNETKRALFQKNKLIQNKLDTLSKKKLTSIFKILTGRNI